jgi:hypothetical protein
MKKKSADRLLKSPPEGDASPAPDAKSLPRRILTFAAVFLWMAGIVAVFYIFHKPLPPAAWERIRDASIDLLAAGWMIWIGIGVGRFFLPKEGISAGERIALSGALGLGAASLAFLIFTWAGLFTRLAVFLICALLTLAVSLPLARDIRDRIKDRARTPPAVGGFSLILGSFLAVSLILSLGIALSPPIAWDALVYHLRIPQQIVAGSSLSLPGDSLFREFPLLTEMLYAAAVSLTGRSETAAVLGWGIAVLALIGVSGTARRWGLRHSLLPAAILLAGDTLARSAGWGYADWTAALLGYAAVCSLSRRERGMRWIFLAGCFSGLAMGTKYTAGIVLAVSAVALFSFRERKQFIKEAAVLFGGFVLAFSPWILRGIAFWGNPLPPFLDGGPAAALRTAFFAGQPIENAGLLAAGLPLLQSTVGMYGSLPYGATIGPLLFAFIPGAFLRRPEETPAGKFLLRIFWVSVLLYWAVAGLGGFFSTPLIQPRVYLALFPGLALLSAYGFERLWGIRLPKIRLGAFAAVLTVLVLAFQTAGFAQSWIAAGIPNYLSGSLGRKEYLETNLGWYAPAMESLQSLLGSQRVVMLWEPRGLYCGGVCLEDATLDRWYLAMRAGESPESILRRWREEGWTYVLIFNAGADFERFSRSEYPPSDWEAFDRLRSLLQATRRFGEGYTLYWIPPEE